MNAWVTDAAAEIGRRAERELQALVAVSSPSGDAHAADECVAVCSALLPDEARVERVACSSPDHAQDLVARVSGTGTRRVLLLGHLDTVVAHGKHRLLERDGDRLVGSGSVDMKGGVVLALGVLRALATRPADFAEVALLLVVDEEWRTAPFAHVSRFEGWDACLCFEAGELTPEGHEGVVVRRKAAGTLRVGARGRAAHSGAAPDKGINALLALARAAQIIASCHDPSGPHRRSAVPTVMRSGDAFNVVPAGGELLCDIRADADAAIHEVVAALPDSIGGATLHPELLRMWPGMNGLEVTAPLLARASVTLGRPVTGVSRGGASDASHFASTIPLSIDGLGPRGGEAHNPGEYVIAESLVTRAEVALAVADAALATG
ncbi:MAG: Acetylornithine deacetylase/Succinyl-diaminopimelate desuccinylase and related deacylases [uncultured Solirubrobacteraceae bacterium]|uniref:Acetylornithine deacetylase/Succinyl-diaminopimelate desuccinylase and related deacylases n=1 Tax=uncultured Solirubrobacteraceae bacterium TaxID=1162706 RepID=A0A6J4RYM2_9ACTN|nr:MAG: Acetylornithine deacetylase/Succinyl-diaminopimelate desuccinylase and related deacylases [uncultured Solirubrobacteraceae bacterium]